MLWGATVRQIRYAIAIVLAITIAFLAVVGIHSTASVEAKDAPPALQAKLTEAGLTMEQVADGVYALIASTDYPPASPKLAICNGGFAIGSDGVLVIDPFQTPALGDLMLEAVASVTDKPVRYVLNTHYHFDHTGGNPAAAAQGIPVVGRGAIREYIADRNKSLDPNPKLPDIVVNSETELWLGDRGVKVERVEGHSQGTDVVAYIPDAKVLFAGDMVFNQRIPYTADSDLRSWQGSLYRLIAQYPDAKVVPGHGPLTDVGGIKLQQAYFNQLERTAMGWKAQGLTKEEAIAQASQIPAAFSGYKFQGLYQGNLEKAYEQFATSLTIPLVP